jgi:hypothetical protein
MNDWMLTEGLRAVLFLHIPKTAGTSFKLALRDCLPAGRLMFDVNGAPNHEVVESLFAMAPERRARLKVIGAHVPYGLHELFPGAGYVTLLREPIERVLSTYYFAKSRTELRWSREIADGMTIEEFAEDVFNDNAQVRRLMKYSNIARADVFEHPPAGKLTRAHLDDAKDTLRRCTVVGLTERYETFLDQVSVAFGLPPLPVRTDNITSIAWRERQIPNRTIDRLREINHFDVELYAYAQGLLAQRAIQPTAHLSIKAPLDPQDRPTAPGYGEIAKMLATPRRCSVRFPPLDRAATIDILAGLPIEKRTLPPMLDENTAFEDTTTSCSPYKGRYYTDFTAAERSIYLQTALKVIGGPEAIVSLIRSVEHVVRNSIPGALVECGVFMGGNIEVMIRTLQHLQVDDRDIYLYDTFAGMPRPDECDDEGLGGALRACWETHRTDADGTSGSTWMRGTVEAVRERIDPLGYPSQRLHFVKGMVEDTIPGTIPREIAILRLDTDFYSSTKHELVHLYPRLAPGGILIIDDYGAIPGSRLATDEYAVENKIGWFLHRVDPHVRLVVKNNGVVRKENVISKLKNMISRTC